ncbi:MAG: Na/Pi cotransporter family protein [Halomonadaceae bacterium]|nr:MAG: Na/Pi cotransporter family protein [Halomonadaceae bacterium]
MSLTAIFTFAGGIGLFLLGMRMMTDGLKVAAGNTLRDILVAATRSRVRGVLSGMFITTMVQSSSAVIFATIGFVNAGLLTLGQAIGIIYGSNVGTTLTSWIVALVGFNVNLQALGLPAIGIGTGLWVVMGARRYGALGQALAGFGLFFLGLDILKNSFAGSGDIALLASWTDMGLWSLLLFMVVGILLTVIMQSSSAALAVTLTAAAGGVIPLESAAAMLIGANVGTTSTALFAIIGATAAAKRAASAHVIFNMITAVVSLAALPLLLMVVELIARGLGLQSQPATLLAILHTMTKLLGLMLLWPATDLLVRQLEKRFQRTEKDLHRPHFLDPNIQTTPALALDALAQELDAMGQRGRQLASMALNATPQLPASLEAELEALETISLAVGEFSAGIHSQEKDSALTTALPEALRIAQYYVDMAEHAIEFQRLQSRCKLEDTELAAPVHDLYARAGTLLIQQEITNEETAHALELASQSFERHYDATKNTLLAAAVRGRLPASRLAVMLEQLSVLRRLIQYHCKALRHMQNFNQARRAPQPLPAQVEDVALDLPEANR